MESIQISHAAFADESYYCKYRFRSIAVISLEYSNRDDISLEFRSILNESGINEFKWNKLRQARDRFAAIKLVDETIKLALEKLLRVDVLIWDTYDNRHRIKGRDDIANIERMYYHLFKNILLKRWPVRSTWVLFPDENSALNWPVLQGFLDEAGLLLRITWGLFDKKYQGVYLSHEYKIIKVDEISSKRETICQVADLFAGLGAYSHSIYHKYFRWFNWQAGQFSLEVDDNQNYHFSNSECERFLIMKYLDDSCKRYKLHVGLKTTKGFKTYNPRFPINFWIYESQNEADKAPTK
jgi:hypothetical protein